MSLYRQLILVLTVVIVSLSVGNLVVSVGNARHYLSEQMQVHAQDTATSLGFSLSRAAQAGDSAQLNGMIDVIFDRGYYQHIVFRDLEGQTLVRREAPVRIDGVGMCSGVKTSVYLQVRGAGHYLPEYAGNLDIMTSAALATGEKWAAQTTEAI